MAETTAEFTPEQLDACARAEAICSQAETCASDIRKKLGAWGLSEEDAGAVIDHLKESNFINDERYARAYVKDKFRFNGWGRQKISFKLRSKKISREIQDAAFAEIEEEAYSGRLLKLLSDKAGTIKARDPYDLRVKLIRFAMGRGFESSQIRAALAEMSRGNDSLP
jgi:regulatory protein